jgi:hypothetical protein
MSRKIEVGRRGNRVRLPRDHNGSPATQRGLDSIGLALRQGRAQHGGEYEYDCRFRLNSKSRFEANIDSDGSRTSVPTEAEHTPKPSPNNPASLPGVALDGSKC